MFLKIVVIKGFWNIQREMAVLDFPFNKIPGQQLSFEYCEIFKNDFFHKMPPVTASEIFIYFPGKHQRQRSNRFIFIIITSE